MKIIVGFVHQTFEQNADGQFVCSEQAFIAGDECNFEDTDGEPLKDVPEYKYQPYEMASPRNKEPAVKYLLYNDVLGALENEEPIQASSWEEALTEVLRSMGYSVIEAQKHKDE